MSMMIVGIGTALPPYRISQTDAAEIAKTYSCETAAQERLFQTLYRRAGVDGRNSVVLHTSDGSLESRQTFYGTRAPTTLERMQKYEAEASSLAEAAAETALREATNRAWPRHSPGYDFVQRILCPRFRHQSGQAITPIGWRGPDAHRLHGLPGCA